MIKQCRAELIVSKWTTVAESEDLENNIGAVNNNCLWNGDTAKVSSFRSGPLITRYLGGGFVSWRHEITPVCGIRICASGDKEQRVLMGH